MARYGRLRFKKRKGVKVQYLITGVVTMGIALLVGNNILSSIGTTVGNLTCTNISAGSGCGDYAVYAPMRLPFEFLGMNTTGGTWTQTGIVGVLGLAAVASFVLAFIKISLR